MNRKKLLFPEDIRGSLARRFRNQHANWLNNEAQWPLVIALGSPTEREVAEDVGDVRAWVAAWSAWQEVGEISWENRQWYRLGRQRIPTNLRLASPEQVATIVGQEKRWICASERYQELIAQWPILARSSVLRRHFDALADYNTNDFERLFSLVLWLDQNRKSGLYPRQLPIEGLDTKWLESRRVLVTGMVRAIQGESQELDFFVACGLRRPRYRIRARLLCPDLRRAVGGLEDIEAPVEEMAALPLVPAKALIVENLETGLALPDLSGVVALMKLGGAVSILETLPWLQGIDTFYWGDIDTHGYAILAHARRALPRLKSVLMDSETLLNNRNFWVEEFVQNDSAELSRLEDHERMVYEGLRSQAWGMNIRLEQERIPWACALPALKESLFAS
jgi:hypothetical protein